MNKTTMILTIVLAAGISAQTMAKVKKNMPKSKALETAIEEAGEKHNPEKMKINKIGSIEVGETFYHAFTGTPKKMEYRVLFFDNDQNYLGYYETEFEPCDYEEGAVCLDSGDGETYYYLRIKEKGLSDKVRLDNGVTLTLVKPPKKKAPEAAAAGTAGAVAAGPEYREWKVTMKGRQIPFRAVLVKIEGSMIFLKDEKRGIEKGFQFSTLSKEDQEYLKAMKSKK